MGAIMPRHRERGNEIPAFPRANAPGEPRDVSPPVGELPRVTRPVAVPLSISLVSWQGSCRDATTETPVFATAPDFKLFCKGRGAEITHQQMSRICAHREPGGSTELATPPGAGALLRRQV